jgi:polyisoprenoid-binding protein YceI
MNKISKPLGGIVLLSLLSFTIVETAVWKYDHEHAKLGFSISHMTVTDVDGSFKDVEATIRTSKSDFSDAVAEMTAQVNSIDTDNEKRDTHLKSPDYFNAEKFPTIVFKSTSFQKAPEENTYNVTGNLTLHGVTKPVTLSAVAKSTIHPYTKKTVAGFKITGKINRKDFGIAEETPAAMLGEDVNIFANAEFIKE